VDTCCAEILPKNSVVTVERSLSDTTGPVDSSDKKYYKEIKELAESKGVELTQEQQALMLLPNTVCSLAAYAWMDHYFKAFGDQVPTKTEIHLEYIPLKNIWEEYMHDMSKEDNGAVGMWICLKLYLSLLLYVREFGVYRY
jgi:hypothetical protein